MADLSDLVVPELGESITEAVVGRWLVAIGDAVDADQPVVDLETDKITVQLPAPVGGALTEQRFAEGDTVKVGDIVGQIDSSSDAASSGSRPTTSSEDTVARPEASESRPTETSETSVSPRASESRPTTSSEDAVGRPDIDRDALLRLTPAQRRVARQTGELPDEEVPVVRDAPAVAAAEEVVKMSPMRQRIAQRLIQAQHETASLTTFNEVDLSAIMALRAEHKESFHEKHGVKLGYMSFFAKAAVAACKLFPGLNAEIRDDSIVYKHHYDFGIAVSTERGLVVPVLRHVDALSFAEIEAGIMDLAIKARDSKLVLSDLVGGTFTITNGGIFGSMLSTPLLNYPQTGIIGMHNIVRRPVAVGDGVEVRPIMYVALTYDHRVVDGKEAVQFLVAMKDRLENPGRLMFDL